MPIHDPSRAHKPYRPSNGTEGQMFEDRFCCHCRKFVDEEADEDEAAGCRLPDLAMLYEISDPKYPKQWVFDADGRPTCKEFEQE